MMLKGMLEKSFSAFDDLVEDAKNAEEEEDEEWLEEVEQTFRTQLEGIEDFAHSTEPEDKVRDRLDEGEKLSKVIEDYKEERLEQLVENLPI